MPSSATQVSAHGSSVADSVAVARSSQAIEFMIRARPIIGSGDSSSGHVCARTRASMRRAFVPGAVRSCRRGGRARADGYVIPDYVNREAASFGRRVRGGPITGLSDSKICTPRDGGRSEEGPAGPRRALAARPGRREARRPAPKAAPRSARTTRRGSGDDRDGRSATRPVAFLRCTGRDARIGGARR